MAFSIISNLTSNAFLPSANPINLTVDSTNSGKCNFRYICDVYIAGTKVHTLKLFPDPSTGYGFFQISRVVNDYIKTRVQLQNFTSVISLGTDTSVPNSLFQLQCKFGEEFDSSSDCTGQVGQTQNIAQSNIAYVFEYAVDYEDFPSWSQTDYVVGTQSASTKFLTNSPREVQMTYNDTWCTDFITLQAMTASQFFVDIKTYDASGTGIATYSYTTTSTLTQKRGRIACGPYDLNKIAQNTIINPQVKTYTMNLRFGSSTTISEIFTFKLKDPTKFNTRIGFVGLGGSIENFTFFHRRGTQFQIERKEFNKTLQSNISSQWKYRVGDRGQSMYGIDAQQTGNVSSFVYEDESLWLNELWLSPDVWTYRRPELWQTLSYNNGGQATFYMYEPEYASGLQNKFSAGDYVFFFDSTGTQSGRYLVNSFVGNNLVLSGSFTASVAYCGWIQKDYTFDKLPIVPLDQSVEQKRRTGRPIEYQLTYKTSYTKTTLR